MVCCWLFLGGGGGHHEILGTKASQEILDAIAPTVPTNHTVGHTVATDDPALLLLSLLLLLMTLQYLFAILENFATFVGTNGPTFFRRSTGGTPRFFVVVNRIGTFRDTVPSQRHGIGHFEVGISRHDGKGEFGQVAKGDLLFEDGRRRGVLFVGGIAFDVQSTVQCGTARVVFERTQGIVVIVQRHAFDHGHEVRVTQASRSAFEGALLDGRRGRGGWCHGRAAAAAGSRSVGRNAHGVSFGWLELAGKTKCYAE